MLPTSAVLSEKGGKLAQEGSGRGVGGLRHKVRRFDQCSTHGMSQRRREHVHCVFRVLQEGSHDYNATDFMMFQEADVV